MQKNRRIWLIVIIVLLIVSLVACCKKLPAPKVPPSKDNTNGINAEAGKPLLERWTEQSSSMSEVWNDFSILWNEVAFLASVTYDSEYFTSIGSVSVLLFANIPIAVECRDNQSDEISAVLSEAEAYGIGKFTQIPNTYIYASDFLSTYHFLTKDVKKVGDAYYSNDESTLIKYLGNEATYEISAQTTSIGMGAFIANENLTNITIPDNVEKVGYMAFYACTNLSDINMSSNIASIGGGAFQQTAWNDNQPNGLMYIGKIAYKYNGVMPANTDIVIKDGTVSIYNNVFKNCENLKSIVIPTSVTNIGAGAFDGCVNLKSISIPAGVTKISNSTFVNCSSLENIDIPSDVTKIGLAAFSGCSNLKSVTIPKKVEEIGVSAFHGCTSLNTITIPTSVTEIGSNAFEGTPWYNNQPNGLLYFGKVLYKYKGEMPAFTEVRVQKGTVSIGSSAFSGYANLASIELPDSVKNIGYAAFQNCTGLTGFSFVGNITNIGSSAFQGCSNLLSISLPATVTKIESFTFRGCSSLTEVVIHSDIIKVGDYAFSGCSNVTSVIMSNRAEEIGKGAFENCVKLESVTMLAGVTKVGENAFNNTPWYNNQANGMRYIGKAAYKYKGEMPDNTQITINEGVVSISPLAFDGQTNLTHVIIPTSVKSIGKAFSGCTNLTKITYNGTKSQFNAIEKSYSWNDVGISKVICTDGEIALD